MGTTVLYAEDEPSLRVLVQFWLEDAGYDVLLAEDGAVALELARSQNPDVIVTDAMMPNLSGDDLVVALKADDSLRSIPVLMATAAASPVRVKRMTELGVVEVLAKPIDEKSFVAAVARAL